MSLRRLGKGPLLTRADVPAMPPDIVDPSSVFNPGAVLVDGTTFLLLRVQTRGRRTYTVPACGDGLDFEMAGRPVDFTGLNLSVHHIYDPRITLVDDGILVTTALDTDDGCRLGVWRPTGGDDGFAGLTRLELVGLGAHPDTRNGVLFPTLIGGRHHMLERPNGVERSGGPTSGSVIVLSATNDFQQWEDLGPVMSGRPRYWDELIGPGPPPVLTPAGWLLIYHGVATHFAGASVYQVGAVLLDPEDPRRVTGRTRDNILEPREPWEMTGQVPNVVFPTGMTVKGAAAGGIVPNESEVRIYYGAADSVVGQAVTTIGRLIEACEP